MGGEPGLLSLKRLATSAEKLRRRDPGWVQVRSGRNSARDQSTEPPPGPKGVIQRLTPPKAGPPRAERLTTLLLYDWIAALGYFQKSKSTQGGSVWV